MVSTQRFGFDRVEAPSPLDGHHVGMGEEIELAAKATGAVVEALAEKSGALEPARAYAEAITSGIHYHFYPRVVKQAMAAAEKIKRSGLPRRAYAAIPDRLLKAILEDGSVEDNESMQDRWANLLANVLTEDSAEVRVAFPNILAELEPADAAALDALADRTSSEAFRITKFTLAECASFGADPTGVENLNRLALLHYVRTMPTTVGSISDEGATIIAVRFTELGWAFVQACRTPVPRD
jgi:hypothetical protein